ncbi:MAG: sensor histidine kinase [Alphaproteobacteria bacterium]
MATRLVLVLVAFVVVPVIVYGALQRADAERNALLVVAARDQGKLLIDALRPALGRFGVEATRRIDAALQAHDVPGLRIKVLYRPTAEGTPDGFYYVAARPQVAAGYLEAERAELVRLGVIDTVAAACDGGATTITRRYVNPAGELELLAALATVTGPDGCWAVVTARSGADWLGSGLGRPFWQTPQAQLAGAIYLVLALFVIAIFADVWRDLGRFANLARRIGAGASAGSFRTASRIPELDGLAAEFDRMVGTLGRAAVAMRHAAEDNAHAFKGPIAVIAQSIEPLRGLAARDGEAAMRAVDRIEAALNRLDGLVGAARRLDEQAADLLVRPTAPLPLDRLLADLVEGLAEEASASHVTVRMVSTSRVDCRATAEAIETMFENLIENAVSFSPRDGTVHVSLDVADDMAVVCVEDDGPGVPEERLERIFERYASFRDGNGDVAGPGAMHFGIGLWVVRRNAEALGGTVVAENRPGGGLRVTVRLPCR